MIIHRQFQHQTGLDKGTDVQFNLDGNGIAIVVSNIQLHSNYESGLPQFAYIEYNDDAGRWQLCTYNTIEGQKDKIREWVDSEIANEILGKILAIKEAETPRFL